MSLAALLDILGDGRLHSGETLAHALNVSRTAVWKSVERLRSLGVAISALPRAGYRMPQSIELLDLAAIKKELTPEHRRRLRSFDLHFETDSTNSRLLAAEPLSAETADVAFAEIQTSGRGRRGQRWIAPFGSGLALSLSWNFREQPKDLPALTLAVGVAVAAALARGGAEAIQLKWPNDIWFDDRKLGGILTELRAEAGGPAFVVIGIGLNIALNAVAREEIEATGVKVASLAEACAVAPSRNRVAGAIIDEVLGMLQEFGREGFPAFAGRWSALDALAGRPACIVTGGERIAGIARGIDADGALRVETDERIKRYVAGEVSLRLGSVNL
jgi:BirA family transcriptional regulator, biotin operon repressor / biotin---[acetyl-CoA-carboxylase] ligase